MADLEYFAGMLARIRIRGGKALMKAATLLRDEHIASLSGQNPGGDNPAPKGEFPRQRTGDTAASVIMVPDTLGEMMQTGKVKVGLRAGTRRPGALYHHGWLGVRDTYKRIRPQIRAILQGV